MTNWTDVLAADCAVPEDRPLAELSAELEIMLTAPDPDIRDRLAYSILATWVDRGVLDQDLIALGDRMAAMLEHPAVQARTFAALILGEVAARGIAPAQDVLRWRDVFATWWPAEQDLRGHDAKLGWLHAGAHGADLLAGLGANEHLSDHDLGELLSIVVRRLSAPTDHLYADAEDDRIAHAIFTILTRPELHVQTATSWLDPVEQELRAAKGGPTPAHAANTTHTLRSLYLMVDRGASLDRDGEPVAVPHRIVVLDRLAQALKAAWPRLAAPQR